MYNAHVKFEVNGLEEVLQALGALLESRRLFFRLVVAGGGSLLLLGLIDRPTADVDVVALDRNGEYTTAEPLPRELALAVADVALAYDLDAAWLNCGPTQLLDLGLPPGFKDRVTVRRFGGLEVILPGRQDLLAFKLYAAADQGTGSKHFRDLENLSPASAELLRAARWTTTHDRSDGFRGELILVLGALGVETNDAAF